MPEGDVGNLWTGVLIGLGLTVLGLGAAVVSMGAGIGFVLLFGVGIGQALWMIPAFVHFYRKGQKETGKGILIVAGIVFLLNATCFGFVISGKFKIGG